MAKKYALRNTTTKPPRPIYVVACAAGDGTPGQHSILINTDGIPVFLTQSQYDSCKDAVSRYVKAKMLKLDVLEAREKKELPPVELDVDLPDLPGADTAEHATYDPLVNPETKDDYELYCLHHFGMNIDKRKSLAKIKAEVAELEAE